MGAPNRGGVGACEEVAGAGMATDPSLGRGRCVQQLQRRSTAEADGCRRMAERAPENSPGEPGPQSQDNPREPHADRWKPTEPHGCQSRQEQIANLRNFASFRVRRGVESAGCYEKRSEKCAARCPWSPTETCRESPTEGCRCGVKPWLGPFKESPKEQAMEPLQERLQRQQARQKPSPRGEPHPRP